MVEATRIPREVPLEAAARLSRLRRLAWLLDRSIGLGGKSRFGIDPVIGLIPVAGDWIAAVLSLYVVYEALRLGLPWSVLGRMLANVGIEALVGVIPVLGDIFDFVWQANSRNLALVERHYHPRMRPRSMGSIALFMLVLGLIVIALTAAAVVATVWLLKHLLALF